MLNQRKVLGFALSVAAAGVLTGCGDEPAKVDAPVPSYTLFQDSTGVKAIDPSNPTTPIVIKDDTGVSLMAEMLTSVKAAKYSGTSGMMTDRHNRWAVFQKDGKLWKLDLLAKNAVDSVSQLSSHSVDVATCGFAPTYSKKTYTDFSDANQSILLFKETTCDPAPDWVAVNMGATATDAPVSAIKPVVEIRHPSTGAITGFLIEDSGFLKTIDRNFDPLTMVAVKDAAGADLDVNGVTPMAKVAGGKFVLQITDGVDGLDDMHIYNSVDGSLSASIYDFSDGVAQSMNDGQDIFLLIDNSVTGLQDIARVRMDGSETALTAVVNSIADFQNWTFSDNKLVYQDGGSIKAIAKDASAALGVTPDVLVTNANPGDISLLVASGSWVYFDNVVNGVDTASFIKEDGTGEGVHQVSETALGVTVAYDSVWETATISDSKLYGTADVVEHMVLMGDEFINTVKTPVLSSYKASSNTMIASVATLDGFDSANMNIGLNTGFGPWGMATISPATGDDTLYYIDASKSDSLSVVATGASATTFTLLP